MPRRAHVIAVTAALAGCATLQQLAALQHVDFALTGVKDGRLAGVSLERVASYQDLTVVEVGRIAAALSRNELPLAFTVDVLAENPPDNRTTATLVQLRWSAFLDDKETVSGVLDSAFTLPPGQPVTIPLQVNLDLRKFFDGPAASLVNLAAGLAGLRSEPTRVSLRARPTINTPLGPITYPSDITIVNRTVGAPRDGVTRRGGPVPQRQRPAQPVLSVSSR
jgi:hypothetical protein